MLQQIANALVELSLLRTEDDVVLARGAARKGAVVGKRFRDEAIKDVEGLRRRPVELQDLSIVEDEPLCGKAC